MEELNYKAAYLYLVGAVDDVICQLEQPDGQGNTFAALTALRQAPHHRRGARHRRAPSLTALLAFCFCTCYTGIIIIA